MTYNEFFFEDATVRKLNNEIEILIAKQLKVLDFIKKFLLSTNGKIQKSNCYCFLDLAVKTRFNLEIINESLKKLLVDYRFKTSINILYRSIIDDLINASYLAIFLLKDDSEQISLGNELKILHKEFLQSARDTLEAETNFTSFLQDKDDGSEVDMEEYFELFRKENSDLITT